jgi:hypothetical protein
MELFGKCQVVCIRCHGTVVVGRTERGKVVPLEPGPDPSGALAVSKGPGGAPQIRYLRPGGAATSRELRMMAHWDASPGCKPPRKRRRAAPGTAGEVVTMAAPGPARTRKGPRQSALM